MEKIDIINTYLLTNSLRQTSRELGLSESKIRKILIDAGVYTSDRQEEIRVLRSKGLSPNEIADRLKISVTAINAYLPYQRGIYKKGAGEHK